MAYRDLTENNCATTWCVPWFITGQRLETNSPEDFPDVWHLDLVVCSHIWVAHTEGWIHWIWKSGNLTSHFLPLKSDRPATEIFPWFSDYDHPRIVSG